MNSSPSVLKAFETFTLNLKMSLMNLLQSVASSDSDDNDMPTELNFSEFLCPFTRCK